MSPEERYRLLGRLLEQMPEIPNLGPIPANVAQWLGRADAVIETFPDFHLKGDWRVAQTMLTMARSSAVQQINLIIHRAVAAAELSAPASARGAFIPVGRAFDAFAAVGKLFQTAKSDVLIVDPYLDETILTEFETLVPAGIPLRLLADKHFYKASLIPAAMRWVQQRGAERSLEVRLAPEKSLHDRAIIIDRAEAWTLTQSLKDFAKRSPAEIVNAGDIAQRKIPAYEQIWANADVVV
jgi:hypothetical protein